MADTMDGEVTPEAGATVPDPADETKGERTRRRLLGIAVDRFGRRGFRGTSVSEIAREAGLTQAAVYAYFDNKTALFDAAVDADADAIIRHAQARTEGVEPLNLIPTLMIHMAAAQEDHPLVRRVLRGEEPDALPRLIHLPALTDFTTSLAATLAEAQDAGTVRSDIDAETFAEGAETMILALLLGMEQLRDEIEDRRRMAVGIFFIDALRPPR